MNVEIWSDIVCPWCYIGKRRFESAVARFEHAGEVEVTYRSFELDPNAPQRPERPMVQLLAHKYGRTIEQSEAMLAQLDELAAAEGLDYHLEETTGGNTFDAHRLIHLGYEHGHGGDVKEALLHAYFVERVPVSDPDVLRRVGVSAGLPAPEIDELLAGDRFAAAVRADEARAYELGATGVPFFVIDNAYAIPGAQNADTMLATLRRAWDRSHPALTTVDATGGACTGDACAV